MGQFYYAAKAFDILEKFDPTPENWEGKRGACVGVFQLIIANQEPKWELEWDALHWFQFLYNILLFFFE